MVVPVLDPWINTLAPGIDKPSAPLTEPLTSEFCAFNNAVVIRARNIKK